MRCPHAAGPSSEWRTYPVLVQPLASPDAIPKAPKPIKWWMAVAALALIGLSIWGVYAWLSTPVNAVAPADTADLPQAQRLEIARLRMDIIRNALTVGAGLGGLLALALSFRRQHHTEHQQRHLEYVTEQAHEQRERDLRQREAAAKASEDDALQRRITELRIQAVAQLGHDRAAVRIGGLHNLERLGSMYPELRQTVLDEICAYLRMPFDPKPAKGKASEVGQEQQVRDIALALITRHLRDEGEYWDHKRIDLSGAVLSNANFFTCKFSRAIFRRTEFRGSTRFVSAHFQEFANFNHARFDNNAWFTGARFDDFAVFTATRLEGSIWFDSSRYQEGISFHNAKIRKGHQLSLPEGIDVDFEEREGDPDWLWLQHNNIDSRELH